MCFQICLLGLLKFVLVLVFQLLYKPVNKQWCFYQMCLSLFLCFTVITFELKIKSFVFFCKLNCVYYLILESFVINKIFIQQSVSNQTKMDLGPSPKYNSPKLYLTITPITWYYVIGIIFYLPNTLGAPDQTRIFRYMDPVSPTPTSL